MTQSISLPDLMAGANPGVDPDTTIGPGDHVRSYDFPGNDSCYAEGLVQEITDPIEGCPRYKVRVETRVFAGEVQPVHEDYVYPPVNGTPTFSNRVTNMVVRQR